MPKERPWPNETFIYYFLEDLTAHLRRTEREAELNADLLERLFWLDRQARAEKTTDATTVARCCWACKTGLSLVLTALGLNQLNQRELTAEKLHACASALERLLDAVNVEKTELRVTHSMTGAEQRKDDTLVQRNKLFFELIGVFRQTEVIVRGEDAEAVAHAKRIVADQFLKFLELSGITRDALVDTAAELLEVHA